MYDSAAYVSLARKALTLKAALAAATKGGTDANAGVVFSVPRAAAEAEEGATGQRFFIKT